MRVAVLGASGGMGSFFARYLAERGAEVRGSDPGRRAGRAGAVVGSFARFRTNAEAVKGCDYTILAVPMEKTLDVAGEVAGRLEPGSTLVEITSVKGETVAKLRKLLDGRADLLSIHPLFGPALESTAGMKVAVVSEKEREAKDTAAARALFPDARVIPMSREEHDEAMAVVLALTHLLNVVYAATVARFLSPEEFRKVSTPNSSMQLTLAEAVLAQDPRLSYAIQATNPHSKRVAREASRELKRLLAMIEGREWEAFEEHFSGLSKRYRTDKRAASVVREIYSAAEKGA